MGGACDERLSNLKTNDMDKKLYIWLAGLILPLFLVSCDKEEVSTFNTDYTALNIWVGNAAGAVYKSATYNYSYAYEEGSVTFYAQISGMPVDHDRVFHLEPYGGDLQQVVNTIRLEDYVIPAGEIGGEYKVYFNTQKLQSPTLFTTKDGSINFRGLSQTFSPDIRSTTQSTAEAAGPSGSRSLALLYASSASR